jgi:hypothetical protein
MRLIREALGDARRRALAGLEASPREHMRVYSMIYNDCIGDKSPGKTVYAAFYRLFEEEMDALCTEIVSSAIPLPKKIEACDAGTRFIVFVFRYLDRFYRQEGLESRALTIIGSVLSPHLLAETHAIFLRSTGLVPTDRDEDTVIRMVCWQIRNGFGTAVLGRDLVAVLGRRLPAETPPFRDADALLAYRAALIEEIDKSRLVPLLNLRGAIEDKISDACCADERPLVSGMRIFLRNGDTNKIRVLFSFAKKIILPAFREYISEAIAAGPGALHKLMDVLPVVHDDYLAAFREAVQEEARRRPGFVAETVRWYRDDAENAFIVSLFSEKTGWFACYEKILYRSLMEEEDTIGREEERLRRLEQEADAATMDRMRIMLYDFAESRRYSDETGGTDRLVILSKGAPSDPLRGEPTRPWDSWLMPEILSYFQKTGDVYRKMMGKKLVFSLWNSSVGVGIHDGRTSREAVLSVIQMAFLYLVFYRKKNSSALLAEATGINPGIVSGVLDSLSRGDHAILRGSRGAFVYAARHDGRVYAPRLPVVKKTLACSATSGDALALRAAIVRVMKREKESTVGALVERFPKGVEEQVSFLVEHEYLERDGDRLSYVP